MSAFLRKFRFTGSPQSVLIIRLLLVLLLMVATRLMLYFLHTSLFPGINLSKLLYYAFAGMRYDIVALLYANSLYFLFIVLPFRFRRKRVFSIVTDTVFYISNIILLIPNFADTAYYPFSLKRMTIDIFKYISTGDDTANMMPQFLRDYWYLVILLLTAIFIIILIVRQTRISSRYVLQKQTNYYLTQTASMILFFALFVLGVRGGIQLKPVGILSASQYAPSQETPVVLNSAFTLMRSSGQQGIKKVEFYKDEKELNRLFNPDKNYLSADSLGNILPMQKKNVFIIILESFSGEHIGALNHQPGNKKKRFYPFSRQPGRKKSRL
jgi:hypothetical protein